MQTNLMNLVKDISNQSQQVASSSEELTATSQQSATAIDEVARVIEKLQVVQLIKQRIRKKGLYILTN